MATTTLEVIERKDRVVTVYSCDIKTLTTTPMKATRTQNLTYYLSDDLHMYIEIYHITASRRLKLLGKYLLIPTDEVVLQIHDTDGSIIAKGCFNIIPVQEAENTLTIKKFKLPKNGKLLKHRGNVVTPTDSKVEIEGDSAPPPQTSTVGRRTLLRRKKNE